MSGQTLPNVNVIRDTPTSPGHTLHREYTAPPIPRQTENAPEVDLSNRDEEGLQVDENGPYPKPTTDEARMEQKQAWTADSGPQTVNDAGLEHIGNVELQKGITTGARPKKTCGMPRRTFLIVAVVVLIVVVAAAVGGGVGGYYANKNKKDSPVTSGTTGMAALPCSDDNVNDLSNPYLATGATFTITCHRGVPGSGDKQGRPIVNIAQFIHYDFKSCMDECAANTKCMGAVYGANLTAMVQDGDPGANCLLKNGTWEATASRIAWMASGVKE
ncbi:hypothetical protein BDV96DRAFT_640855 [Lophiotrema nucula]|uniref:Apple domain-containing protein n=1 Tax=Lophiotrema nucula TaxID=690887 RepID=A0A6A5ZRG7_9PLEO|nr:hypothetical protein BDV96DRAFT_640855 [Lophiotrema nucula]